MQQQSTEQITHNITEHCLSNHVLEPSSVGCHSGIHSPGDGSYCSGNLSLKQLLPFAAAIGPALSPSMMFIFWPLQTFRSRPPPDHSTPSPEAWGPDSSVTRTPAWCRPGRPALETIRYRDLIWLILLKFKFMTIAPHESVSEHIAEPSFDMLKTEKNITICSKIVSPNLI